MITKEHFRAQFAHKITFKNFTPVYDQTTYGYKIYRALELLVLEENGQFYTVHDTA